MSCGGAGQEVVLEVKQVLVVVSQQLMPLEGGPQLFWHCALVVQVATHAMSGGGGPGTMNFARSGLFGPESSPQPAANASPKHITSVAKI
jgi:hypothetical protein